MCSLSWKALARPTPKRTHSVYAYRVMFSLRRHVPRKSISWSNHVWLTGFQLIIVYFDLHFILICVVSFRPWDYPCGCRFGFSPGQVDEVSRSWSEHARKTFGAFLPYHVWSNMRRLVALTMRSGNTLYMFYLTFAILLMYVYLYYSIEIVGETFPL